MTITVRSNDPAQPVQSFTQEGKTLVETVKEPKSAPEAKAPEHKESTESGTGETEAEEVEHSEAEESEDHEPKDDDKEEKPGKKKGGFQRRIDKLSQQKQQAQQEVEYWKQQALKTASDPKKESVDSKPVASDGKPSPDKYPTHSEYVEALTDWKTEQKFKDRDQKSEQKSLAERHAEVVQTYTERKKAFAAITPDFDEVIGEVDGTTVSHAVRDILVLSENGPELAYELAKNPKEFERINKLPPMLAAQAMGRFESKLTPKASEDKTTETKKITKAPKPLEPVGTGGKGSAPKTIFDAAKLSQREYEAFRKQEKKRRQA
jgi:hypothetical protein